MLQQHQRKARRFRQSVNRERGRAVVALRKSEVSKLREVQTPCTLHLAQPETRRPKLNSNEKSHTRRTTMSASDCEHPTPMHTRRPEMERCSRQRIAVEGGAKGRHTFEHLDQGLHHLRLAPEKADQRRHRVQNAPAHTPRRHRAAPVCRGCSVPACAFVAFASRVHSARQWHVHVGPAPQQNA